MAHKDRTWSAQYESGKATDPAPDIAWSAEIHAALQASFLDWIHEPGLWRMLADTRCR